MEVHLPELVQAALDDLNMPNGDAPFHADEHLADLTKILCDKRKEAIDGRAMSGIEGIWAKCEDNYACVDEMNRGLDGTMRHRYAKPTTPEGPLTSEHTKRDDTRSTAFVPLTPRYVDAGKAKVCEILFPANDRAFSLEETPIPHLIDAAHELDPVMINGQQALRDPKPEELQGQISPTDPLTPPPVNPAMPPAQMPGVPLLKKDVAEERIQEGKTKAKKAEDQIYDWLVEDQYTSKMRVVMGRASKLGVGIVKCPVAKLKKSTAISKTPQGYAIQRVEKVQPGIEAVDPWDFFPDPSCGDNIHNGNYIFERAYLSEKQLLALKEVPGYIPGAIDQVVKEGPNKSKEEGKNPHAPMKEERYECWYFTGTITQEDAKALNAHMYLPEGKERLKLPEDQQQLSCVVTLVNDLAIRGVMNTNESGGFNYQAIPWQRRDGSWAGIGPGEQLFMPQALVTAATRAAINNAGASSGPQLIMRRGLVTPADGVASITPFKLWLMKEDAGMDDVRKVFSTFEITNHVNEHMVMIEYGFRLAEEATSIPLITQGQSGKTTPETLGATQLQDNNANQLLRNIGYTVDEFTEAMVRDLYEWLMLDPDVSDDCKGDFTIVAHGSTVMVERAIQDQAIAQMGAIVLNPAFGLNPKKWIAEMMKSKKLDPMQMQYTEEEQAKLAQIPPPKAPQVQAAEINAQATLQRAKLDSDRDTQNLQAQTERTQLEREMRMEEMRLNERLEMLKYANQRQISIDEVKAGLADTAMRLAVEKQLSSIDTGIDSKSDKHVIAAPNEPAGKAEPGKAFSQ